MEINDVIAEAKEMLYCEAMVKELCDSNIDDYTRGVVQGRIEMLTHISMKLDEAEDEISSL
jgi:hypothetical protein